LIGTVAASETELE